MSVNSKSLAELSVELTWPPEDVLMAVDGADKTGWLSRLNASARNCTRGMKKLYSLAGVAAALMLVFSLPGVRWQRITTRTGSIGDSACGAKGMSASHKACALACVRHKGAKLVLVTEDRAVHPIHNQMAVKDAGVGEEANVSGRLLKSGSTEVKRISPWL